jgi:two-component system, OmpR family, sensor histidine kinase KdpD
MVRGNLSNRRRLAGYTMALGGPPVLVAVLEPVRGRLDLSSDALLFMLLVVGTALVGGLGPALLASAWSAALLNFFFTEPFHTFRVHEDTDVVAVLVFTTISVMVSWVVDLAARRSSAVREAAELEAGNRLRTALLAAVGHDLRTPLATAKAVVSGLRSPDVVLVEADRSELLAAADEALDTLSALIDNLLDLSRLQAGALPVRTRPVPLGDVVASALDDIGVRHHRVLVDVPDELPDVVADPGLLERVLVNVVANAQRFAPDPPVVRAASEGHRIVLRVVDNGPGIDSRDRERVFVPFQRLGDTTPSGLGLGLALSRGLVEAMAGSLDLHGTPGGGLTVVISLPAVPAPAGKEVVAP